jgi:hypothetical protein
MSDSDRNAAWHPAQLQTTRGCPAPAAEAGAIPVGATAGDGRSALNA